jgi:cellulose synthase/poly-beta-1,6-N-acetylglucosamine synthase-like glycosyltransferase
MRIRRSKKRDGRRTFPRVRRQWGTERGSGAAPIMHGIPSKGALSGARFALFLTIAAWAVYAGEQVRRYLADPFGTRGTVEAVVYMLLVTLLTASATAHLLARLGHLQRIRAHRRTPRAAMDAVFEGVNPTMTAIIPSYKEDRRVIRQTLLSAALQEFPSLRVVLLIDDPANPRDAASKQLLADARALPGEIAAMLEEPRRRFEAALDAFESSAVGEAVTRDDIWRLAATYDDAALYLREWAGSEEIIDHVDAFLVDEIILAIALDLEAVAAALREAMAAGAEITAARMRRLYRRLVWIFRADMSSFERKRFASLSHEPNKAMNLNSYLGLMGGRYRIRETPAGAIHLPVRGGSFDLEVPDPDYVLTLDADSMLLPEYCLRLVAFMEQPENADVAVVQTPYSAFRGAPTRIERLAGATTDLQHIVHQGLTHYDATFWVGANAVLRKQALDTVVTEESHNGFTVRQYIKDRTVIEDTESSLDMRLAGWRLVNYPERLSYSATPPDFGALCVQRQRWGNGGLLMLGRLLQLVRAKGRSRRERALEGFLRLSYLASVSWASAGLWLLLFYPFDQQLLSRWAVLTAVPYFTALSTDLRRTGYKRRDVFRLYGLNIMLLPVNTAGVFRSIGQLIGGQKSAFARTPKVKKRTITPLTFVTFPFIISVWSGVTLINDLAAHRYLHAAFSGVNALITLWVMLGMHGLRATAGDIARDVYELLLRPVKRSQDEEAPADWVTVLYHGAKASGETEESSAVANALAAIDQESDPDSQILFSLHREAPVTHGPPAAETIAERDVQTLSSALSESIRQLRPGNTLVVRMTPDGLEVGHSHDGPTNDYTERV